MENIIVIDYGMGNLGSILNMLKKIGARATASKEPDDVLNAEKIILPGVGSFDNAMDKLHRLGYVKVLFQKVIIEKTPILGICLGMQLFGRKSEEGNYGGLGWLNAETVRFQFREEENKFKIPHMGWNNVIAYKESPFFPFGEKETSFYFVHSYYMHCVDSNDILTCTHYGFDFTSAVCHDNILGVQFHPEKSHRFGLVFFKAFNMWSPMTLAEE